MDNLTHSLVGALFGQMGLKRKTGLAMPTLIIAANIPDIDAVAVLLGGHQHLAIRRGLTHGPIAMVLLPLLLWGAMLWFDRWQKRRGKRPEKRLPVNKGWLLALAYIGTITHPALDWLNNYGVRLLEPFSHQWFYGDSIFIIDVWMLAALAISVWLSLRSERAGAANWTRPAWTGFAVICAYIFANGVITGQAENAALMQLRTKYDSNASMPDPLVVANAVPVQFWKREMLWRDSTYFGIGNYTISNGVTLSKDVRSHNMDEGNRSIPIRIASEKESDIWAFLFWSRMPVVQVAGDGGVDRVEISDQRFDNSPARDRFMVSILLKGENK